MQLEQDIWSGSAGSLYNILILYNLYMLVRIFLIYGSIEVDIEFPFDSGFFSPGKRLSGTSHGPKNGPKNIIYY